VQALILLPLGRVNHWRFGYFLLVEVGFYLLRSLTRVVALIDFFSHRIQDRDINIKFLIILIHLISNKIPSSNNLKFYSLSRLVIGYSLEQLGQLE